MKALIMTLFAGAATVALAWTGEATGRYRLEKCAGAWWLVDPAGRPYRDLSRTNATVAADAARPAPRVLFVAPKTRRLASSPTALRDPFDPAFRTTLPVDVAAVADPACLGIVVDRGVDFGVHHEDLARQTLLAPDDQPAKVEFLKRLKAKRIAYDPAKGPDQLSSAVLCEFSDALVWEYFYQLRKAVKRLEPKLLYLGCRFAAPPPPWVVAWGGLHTDLFCGDGFGSWRPQGQLDVPVADYETLCRLPPSDAEDIRRLEAQPRPVDETDALQAAIDAAWKRGGGTVEVTAGRHLVRGLRLRSNVTLHLQSDAVLASMHDASRFGVWKDDALEPIPTPATNAVDRWFTPWFRALVRLHAATNAAIVGEAGSCIDGANSYDGDPESEEGFRCVHGILAQGATNCVFRGYRMYRSSNWSHNIRASRGIRFENLTIEAGHDGFHLLRSRDISIVGCTIATGDDAIAGYGNEDVHVKGCTLSSACSIFRFGGRRVTIEDCTARGPCAYPWRGSLSGAEIASGHGDARGRGRRNTLAFYTYFGIAKNVPGVRAGEIVIRNVTVSDMGRFFHYDLSAGGSWQSVPLEDIRFERVTATGIGKALCARGTAEHPVSLAFSDVKLDFAKPQREFVNVADMKSLVLEDVSVTGVQGPACRDYGARPPSVRLQKVTGVDGPTAKGTDPFPTEHY